MLFGQYLGPGSDDKLRLSKLSARDLSLVVMDKTQTGARRQMQEHQVRRIPIVDREDRIIGVVSQTELAFKDKPEKGSKTATGKFRR